MEKVIDLIDVYQELKKIEAAMITKAELRSALETVAVLSNEETMQQIAASENDIREGKVRVVTSAAEI